MIIIGVDFHPAYQEIASVNTDTGEYQEKRLTHPQEAEQFYRCLAAVGQAVRVGMEASGQGRWFERLLEGLGVELWRGDAEVIRAKRGRKQKTDREDARHIFNLLLKDDFPRIWVPSWENRDLRRFLNSQVTVSIPLAGRIAHTSVSETPIPIALGRSSGCGSAYTKREVDGSQHNSDS